MLAEGEVSLNSLKDFRVGEVGVVEETAGALLGDLVKGGCWREGGGMEGNGGPCILGGDLWITDPKIWHS